MRALLAATLLLVAVRPAAARDFTVAGQPFTLNLTDSLVYTYRAQNNSDTPEDENYHHIANVLEAALTYREFQLGLRLDLHLYADTPRSRLCPTANAPVWCAPPQRYVDDLMIHGEKGQLHWPQRLFLTWTRDEFDATGGDFYASFGKGLVLNAVKIDQLGQDTTIRGGKFHYHAHDLDAIFLGGELNPLITDDATAYRPRWSHEPILGGRAEYRILDTVIVGAHGVHIISDDPQGNATSRGGTDNQTMWGAGFDIPKLWQDRLSFSAEVDWQRITRLGELVRGTGTKEPGLAFYASATLHQDAFTLLGEYKHYDYFSVEASMPKVAPYATLLYSQPPTLERIDAYVHDNIGVSGGRLRLDWNAGQRGKVDLLAFVSFGYFHDWQDLPDRVFDPYAGLELRWQEERGHLNLSGGVREEESRATGDTVYRDIHVELDVEQPLAARHSMKLTTVYLRRREPGFTTPHEWNEADLELSYRWSPRISVAINYERQDNPSIVGSGTEARSANYFSGLVQYFFTPGTYISLRGGQSRPGIKCLNGACRFWPGFAGVQVSAVARF